MGEKESDMKKQDEELTVSVIIQSEVDLTTDRRYKKE